MRYLRRLLAYVTGRVNPVDPDTMARALIDLGRREGRRDAVVVESDRLQAEYRRGYNQGWEHAIRYCREQHEANAATRR